MVISPPQVYEVKGQTCKVQNVFFTLGASTNNPLVAASAGIITRVMGLQVQCNAAVAGALQIRNGHGGANLYYFFPPLNTAPPFLLPITDSGYFETTSNTILSVDIVTAAINGNVWYIQYAG